MTTQDKTGEKLVQSIRKTKSTGGAAGSTTGSATASKGAAAKSTGAKPTAASKKVAAKPKAAAAATNGYQSGQRVWPD